MRTRFQSSFNERIAKETGSSPQEGDKACPWQEAHIRKDMMMNGIRGLLDREEGHVYGTLLPIVRTPEGNREFAVPGLLRDAYTAAIDAITLPGDVYAGRRDPTVENALNFALTFMGAGQAIPAPKGSLRMFAGRNAKTADLDALKKAQKMADKDASAADILSETGWFKGADGKWRFEIDDTEAAIGRFPTEKQLQNRSGIQQTLKHDKLFEAYPDLADIPLRPAYGSNFKGSFRRGKDGEPDKIMLDVLENKMTAYAALPAGAKKQAKESMGSTLLHELQHAIQMREGFARGGNPRMFAGEAAEAAEKIPQINDMLSSVAKDLDYARKNNLPDLEVEMRDRYNALLDERQSMVNRLDPIGSYRRLAGEVEARNVQLRRDYSPEMRKFYPPYSTQDIPYSKQIIRGLLSD